MSRCFIVYPGREAGNFQDWKTRMITSLKTVRFRYRALAAVKAAGGKFGFRDDWREGLVSRARGFPRSFVDRALVNANWFIFAQSKATDDLLSQVAKFPLLEFLSISDSPVTDQGLLFLKDLRHLRMLDANDTCISAEGFRNAAWLPSLTSLMVNDTDVDDRIWKCLQQASQVTYLSIGKTGVRSLAGLARHATLTVLCLNGLQLPKDELHHLPSVPNIRDLNLNYTSFIDEDATHLSGHSKLSSLALAGTKITDNGLAQFSNLTALEELIIYDTVITEDGVKAIAHLPNLRFMCLTATNVTDSLFGVLKNMPQLETLFLDETLCESLTNEERSQIPCTIHCFPEDQT